ncbi:MAG: S41 family peptidase [bacterium]|nr:S41 family peptidase [bacterium]
MHTIFKTTILFLSILSVTNLFAQGNQYCKSQKKLIELLNERHLSPVESDSILSFRTAKILLQKIDPYGIYLSSKDQLTAEKEIQKLLSSQCTGTDSLYEFLQLSLERRIIEARNLKKSNLDFTQKDTLYRLNRKRTDNLDGAMVEILKTKILAQHMNKSDSSFREEEYTTIPESIINDVWQKAICDLERIRRKIESKDYLHKLLLQSIANAYDPHTNYLRLKDYENFISEISKTKTSFGFLVYQGFESLRAAEVDKNSPAWRAGIRSGEKIIDIIQDGKSLLSRCLDLYDLNNELTNPEVTEITIITKRDDKTERNELLKEEYNIRDDAYISMLLNGDKKIGYFRLHNFYTDTENLTKDGCANDVAAELVKMKRDGIEGLILDLRDNDGGSLREAIGLAGIFINYGKLAYIRSKEGGVEPMKDFNKGRIFDKPLVIMINESSASAAEVLATILRESGVAVLVGDQTFGKYIGQSAREAFVEDQMAYLITTDIQLYNLHGESFQKTGQKPDIKLPNLKSSRSEASYPFPISSDRIDVNPIEIKSMIPADHLKNLSLERTQDSGLTMDSLLSIYNVIPLNAYEYIEWYNKFIGLSKSLQQVSEPIFDVTPTSYDSDIISLIKEEKENFNLDKSDVESDNQIVESYQIISDWITYQQNEKN